MPFQLLNTAPMPPQSCFLAFFFCDFDLHNFGFLVCYGLQMGVSGVMLEVLDMKNYTLDWIPNAGQNIVMLASMVVYTIANYIYNRTVTFKVKESK